MGELAGGLEPVEDVEVEVVAEEQPLRMRGRMGMRAATGIRSCWRRSRCMVLRVSQSVAQGKEVSLLRLRWLGEEDISKGSKAPLLCWNYEVQG